jgi:hypothetical protein
MQQLLGRAILRAETIGVSLKADEKEDLAPIKRKSIMESNMANDLRSRASTVYWLQ